MAATSAHLKSFVPAAGAAVRKEGFFARLAQRFHDVRLRQAEREVARFIEGRGGRITDDVERKIERHFG